MKKVFILLLLMISLLYGQTTKDLINSTDTALDSAGVFSPTSWRAVTGYTSLTLIIKSNVSSATNGVQIKFATLISASNSYRILDSLNTTYTTGTSFVLTLPIRGMYYKVTYTNGATAQSYFSLVTLLNGVSTYFNFNSIGELKTATNIENASGVDLFTSTNPALVSNIPGYRDTVVTATVDSAASLSSAINFINRRLKTIYLPSAITGTQLTFQVSPDGVTYYNYYCDDTELVMTAGASYGLNVNPRNFVGIQYLKIRFGTSSSASAQTASRTIKLKIGNY